MFLQMDEKITLRNLKEYEKFLGENFVQVSLVIFKANIFHMKKPSGYVMFQHLTFALPHTVKPLHADVLTYSIYE